MPKTMRIIIENTKSKLMGDIRVIKELREATKLRTKGYFFSEAYRKRQWDGYNRYISDTTGLFPTGMLAEVLAQLKKLKCEVEVSDQRARIRKANNIKELNGLVLRPIQLASKDAVLKNRLAGLRFQRGILHEATNFGKSLVSASIMASFDENVTGVLLINNTEIFDQLVEEITQLLGKKYVGFISSKKTKPGKFLICMVQTLYNRVKSDSKVRMFINNVDVVLVDEADEVCNRKDCKYILSQTGEAPIRVALTGTALLHKDKTKNQELINFFGPVIHRTTNKEMIDKGYSVKPDCRFHKGNVTVEVRGDFQTEYLRGIIQNKDRNRKIWKLVEKRLDRGRGPILILIRYTEHIRKLLDHCPKELKARLCIEHAFGKTKARKVIMEKFKAGRVDVFICSMIIKRGKNLPIMRTLINAAAGDSETGVLQILGRLIRKFKNQKKVYYDDFMDEGSYLKRHSKHRIAFLKKDGHIVKEKYKK